MSVFDYKLNRRDQLVRKGEAIDNNIDFSGRTNTDFTNKFVAKMRDTNKLYTKESPGQFDDQRAEIVRKNLITQADNMGQFNDPSLPAVIESSFGFPSMHSSVYHMFVAPTYPLMQ